MANVIEDMLNTQSSESQSYNQPLSLSNSLIGNDSQLLNNNDVWVMVFSNVNICLNL